MIRKDLGDVSGTVAVDCSIGRAFQMRLTGNATLSNPTNLPDWEFVMLKVTADTDGRSLSFDSDYYSPTGNFNGLAGGHATTPLYIGFRRFDNKFVAVFSTKGY